MWLAFSSNNSLGLHLHALEQTPSLRFLQLSTGLDRSQAVSFETFTSAVEIAREEHEANHGEHIYISH